MSKSLEEISELTQDELEVWIQYFAESPQGTLRQDLHFAILGQTIQRTVTSKPAKLMDFIPRFEGEAAEQEEETIDTAGIFGDNVYYIE